MKVEIKVPSVGESVTEGTVGSILKPSGSQVKVDEEIFELETDKVNQAIYAPAEGKLELTIQTGDSVKVGQVVGSIDTEGKGVVAAPPPPPESKKEAPSPKPPPSGPGVRKSIDESLLDKSESPARISHTILREGVQDGASDLLSSGRKHCQNDKKSPEESKDDATDCADLPRECEKCGPAPTPKKPEAKNSDRETRKKMSKLRRTISERLVQVKNETAMLTTFNELDMSAVIAVRQREQENFQKKHGVKLGFMSFFIKACTAALKEYPDLNARIEGDEIVYHNFFDIGIAVGTEKGLMVPVLRNTDQLSSADMEKQLKEFADKARAGKISLDDLQGGTFTITNGGVYGSMLSTPILNPPQSAILGMHSIVKRPVVIEDKIEIRPIMYLALSYDHRIVDGKDSIGFLMHIKKNLEEPARLLLDL